MNRDSRPSPLDESLRAAVWQDHLGGIVYDPDLFRKQSDGDPLVALNVSHQLFAAAFWGKRNAARTQRGGRGSVLFIDEHDGVSQRHWVLRHYRRGGLIGKLITDRYLWLGADATRSFREWRLLRALRAQGLPVPAPVAARYQRHGLTYRADLITAAIPQACTLAQALEGSALQPALWRKIGTVLAQFHAAGVQHADLNAHNIVLDDQQQIYLLDFDRGCLRPVHGSWVDAVLMRLLRSLNKLKSRRGIHFASSDWIALRDAHDAGLRLSS